MIGEQIRILRKEKGITQEQLSEVMGVSVAAVSKWETGQTAPDLSSLAVLADYFEVSIDTLLGHTLQSSRKDALIARMGELADSGEPEEAADTAAELLRRYPNDAGSAETAASLYYKLHMLTGKKDYLRKSVDLTHRLFVLDKDPTELKRLERMSSLGNQYGLLGEWEKSEKYYRDSNLCGINDSAIANVLCNTGRYEEAIPIISHYIRVQMFSILTCLLELQTCYNQQEQPEKALDTLRWGCSLLDGCDSTLTQKFALLGTTMAFVRACQAESMGNFAEAEEAIQDAVQHAKGQAAGKSRHFLQPEEMDDLLHAITDQSQMLLQWLETQPRLKEYARTLLET